MYGRDLGGAGLCFGMTKLFDRGTFMLSLSVEEDNYE